MLDNLLDGNVYRVSSKYEITLESEISETQFLFPVTLLMTCNNGGRFKLNNVLQPNSLKSYYNVLSHKKANVCQNPNPRPAFSMFDKNWNP